MKKVIITVIALALGVGGFFFGQEVQEYIAGFQIKEKISHASRPAIKKQAPAKKIKDIPSPEERFAQVGLATNLKKTEIPFQFVLNGGPAKDGIPALTNPENWITVAEASDWLKPTSEGVLYETEGETRFYPYDILIWHEIVNDTVGDKAIAVTFCPLCNSAIIYDRMVDGETLEFGVSGMLWESNLLMYDKGTESLWSQIVGRAKVGNMMGKTLTLLPAQVITYADLQKNFADAKILSKETGYERAYGENPYGDYALTEKLAFPVSAIDSQVHPKEIFYIVNSGEVSAGAHWKSLLANGEAEVELPDEGGTIHFVVNEDKTITATDADGDELNGYFAMWFSWMTHQDMQKAVWLTADDVAVREKNTEEE